MAFRPPELARETSVATSNYSFENSEDPYDDDCFRESIVAEPSRVAVVQIFESLEQLRVEQNNRVEEVVDCTGLDPDDVFLLLRRYGWDTAAFNEAFFENPEEVRRSAGVSEFPTTRAKTDKGLCGICFTDPGVEMMPCESKQVSLGGKAQPHTSYCQDCWKQYTKIAVKDGKSCLDLRCPTPGCGEAIRPRIVADLLRNDEALQRYRRFCAESLVDDSRNRMRWCPQQGCGRAANEPPLGAKEVKCTCGTMWCFVCGTDAHLPVSCIVVGKWEEKNKNDGECHNWLRANTKPCPKCSNPIEKNGGCMHMTCRKPGGCGHEFCWICMHDWSTHKACNGEKESASESLSKKEMKSELARYGHFFERYVEHHKAQMYANTTQFEAMSDFAKMMCDIHDSFQVMDVKFLTQAVSEIRDCRRFLKWTYAYAYFTDLSKKQRTLFEFHQAQLEETLERLSDIMENTSWDAFIADVVSFRPFYDVREKVISLTDVVHNHFSHLQEAMQNGTLFTQ